MPPIILFGIFIITLSLPINPSSFGKTNDLFYEMYNQEQQNNLYNSDGTDYWAVLIGVGVYAGHSDENRPYMLTAVDKMHDLLLQSGNWKEDHIKVLKGEECSHKYCKCSKMA